MANLEHNPDSTVSYLIEHSHGTCELWIKRSLDPSMTIFYQPQRLIPLSGRGTVLLKPEMVAEAIALDEWMSNHPEVLQEGRTAR